MRIEHPFPPVVDNHCHILILGSFPSVKSRQDGFFYGHPQNRFWKVLSSVFHEPLPQTVEDKTNLLLRHHIALWDVIASCQIQGSSDASIQQAVPVAIQEVISIAPINTVICNGSMAGRLYHRFLEPMTGIEAIILPSTSPANAAWTLDKLIPAWKDHLL